MTDSRTRSEFVNEAIRRYCCELSSEENKEYLSREIINIIRANIKNAENHIASTIFKLAGISIPDGYVSLLWDNGSIIPAFRFNLITIVSSLVLVSFDFIEALIPVIFLFVYSILVRFVSPLVLGGVPLQGDIILALFTSGTLFSTLYILQWYGTTPISLWGKIIYGICAGIVAFLIMGFGTSSVGYVFMVLIMNLVSPVMQIMEDKRIFSKIRKRVIPRLKRMKEV